MIGITDPKLAIFEFDLDLPGRQRLSILIAKHGDKHLVLQLHFGRLPIDIEPCGVAARLAILQYVPPAVVPRSDRHVVGNDV